jgi:hypothetical protein
MKCNNDPAVGSRAAHCLEHGRLEEVKKLVQLLRLTFLASEEIKKGNFF